MANSVNVSALTKYVDQLSSPLIRESVLAGKTVGLISVQTGVKYAEALNIMTSTLTAVAGGTCGAVSPAGGPVLSQQTITVCPIKVEEAICLPVIEQYWIGQSMKKDGSYGEAAPAELATNYTADKVAKIQALIDDILWKGNTSTGSGNLALCNGILANLATASGVVTTSYASPATAANLTSSNALHTVESMIDLIPVDVLDATDLTLFCSYQNFRTIARAIKVSNNFFIDGTKGVDYELIYPGTNVKIVAVRGLNSKFDMVLTPASNIYFGTDLMSDSEAFSMWYDINTDTIYFRAKWKQGVAFAFPQYIVWFNGKPVI